MKVNDYVRTITGKIYKLTENDLKFEMTKQNCKISSPNIIDLIFKDDFVNGCRVKELNGELVIMNTGLIYGNNLYLPIKKIDIKSIVTKEQFESMEYKVGE